MIRVQAVHNSAGAAALTAAARMAVEHLGGDGDGCGLIVRLLLQDVRDRIQPGVDSSEVELSVRPEGTEVVLELRDRGEPISGEPVALHPLVAMGLVTQTQTGTDGHSNVTTIRMALQAHHAVEDLDSVEILNEQVPVSTDEFSVRELTPVDTPALTRLLYRCYGWSYPHPDLYYPERVSAALVDGSRIGLVAVTESGEVVGHWGAVYRGAHVVETGSTVTDPRFRHRGIARLLGEQLLDQLRDRQVKGRFREPVLTHTATQEMALKEGAVIVGIRANRGQALQQVGITQGILDHRSSVTVAFGALLPLESASVFVPADYADILRVVLSHSDWPRHIDARPDFTLADVPSTTESTSSYDAANQSAVIDVSIIGNDLIDNVDSALDRARRGGAEFIEVHLPTAQPWLTAVGAGLIDLGLAYAAYIPVLHEDSDVLVLQWLDDSEVDTSDWQYATPHVEALAQAVVAQIHDAAQRAVKVRREAARRHAG